MTYYESIIESTREMREAIKKYGNQSGSRAASNFSDDDNIKTNLRNAKYSIRNSVYGKQYKPNDRETLLDRARGNVQIKDAIKHGASSSDVQKAVNRGREYAKEDIAEREEIRRERLAKKK